MRARACAVLLAVALLAPACGEDEQETGSAQPQGARLRITLGTQDFPEARILGELWRQALAVNGYTVDLRKRVGPAADLDQELRDGEIDGHVAYTGTVLSVVAGEEVSGLDPEETYREVKAFYAGRGMAVSEMTPFENVDAIATTEAFAQENGPRDDRRPAQAQVVHPRRAARVREPLPRPGGPAGGLRAHQRDVQADHPRGPVHRARRGRRRRRQCVQHRSAARDRRLRRAGGPEAAVRLPERRDGRRRGQARAHRPRGVPAGGRRGEPPADELRHGGDERRR